MWNVRGMQIRFRGDLECAPWLTQQVCVRVCVRGCVCENETVICLLFVVNSAFILSFVTLSLFPSETSTNKCCVSFITVFSQIKNTNFYEQKLRSFMLHVFFCPVAALKLQLNLLLVIGYFRLFSIMLPDSGFKCHQVDIELKNLSF